MSDHSDRTVVDRALTRGFDLLARGDFHPAHEAFEDAWRQTRGSERSLCQGLVQMAAVLHHVVSGNVAGARAIVTRCQGHLARVEPGTLGMEVGEMSNLIATLAGAIDAWGRGGPPPDTTRYRVAIVRGSPTGGR